ncbi:MAG: SagB/ThcOx family dehydrogenase [Negativicutes bacterium]|nr:SagB/ThcOx family dehydrogenase [Negativicutes bacterium]
MKKMVSFLLLLSFVFVISLAMNTASAQDLADIKLVPPETDKGRPLMQVLQDRKSMREYASTPLSLQDLSNLLWAADGITRSDGRRTAPSAKNVQEYDIYVVMAEGVYLYEPKNHELLSVAAGDFRKNAGMQAYVATAPVNLIYVADFAKINWTKDEVEKMYIAYVDVGFIAQNAALFCTSEGLVSVPRLFIDKDALGKVMKLRPDQRIILGTTVGYPKPN